MSLDEVKKRFYEVNAFGSMIREEIEAKLILLKNNFNSKESIKNFNAEAYASWQQDAIRAIIYLFNLVCQVIGEIDTFGDINARGVYTKSFAEIEKVYTDAVFRIKNLTLMKQQLVDEERARKLIENEKDNAMRQDFDIEKANDERKRMRDMNVEMNTVVCTSEDVNKGSNKRDREVDKIAAPLTLNFNPEEIDVGEIVVRKPGSCFEHLDPSNGKIEKMVEEVCGKEETNLPVFKADAYVDDLLRAGFGRKPMRSNFTSIVDLPINVVSNLCVHCIHLHAIPPNALYLDFFVRLPLLKELVDKAIAQYNIRVQTTYTGNETDFKFEPRIDENRGTNTYSPMNKVLLMHIRVLAMTYNALRRRDVAVTTINEFISSNKVGELDTLRYDGYRIRDGQVPVFVDGELHSIAHQFAVAITEKTPPKLVLFPNASTTKVTFYHGTTFDEQTTWLWQRLMWAKVTPDSMSAMWLTDKLKPHIDALFRQKIVNREESLESVYKVFVHLRQNALASIDVMWKRIEDENVYRVIPVMRRFMTWANQHKNVFNVGKWSDLVEATRKKYENVTQACEKMKIDDFTRLFADRGEKNEKVYDEDTMRWAFDFVTWSPTSFSRPSAEAIKNFQGALRSSKLETWRREIFLRMKSADDARRERLDVLNGTGLSDT